MPNKIEKPRKRLVQVGDSDYGFYRNSGYISCNHGINISRGDKLCIEFKTAGRSSQKVYHRRIRNLNYFL